MSGLCVGVALTLLALVFPHASAHARVFPTHRQSAESADEVLNLLPLRINEFLASNQHGLRDEDGDRSDWIELYNPNPVPISLAGYALSDDPADLWKWSLPAIWAPAEGYVLVWASGKNRTNTVAPLHTNFQLSRAEGYLALVGPDGQPAVSAFASGYPAQWPDVSYGCDRADPTILGYFLTPTPGAPNDTSGTGFGPPVVFSRPSGGFTEPFLLTLSTTQTNATIRYALGTNVPTAFSPVYSEPLRVDRTVQVRARAFVDGLLPGPLRSRHYLSLETDAPELLQFKSSLPLVVVHTYGGGAVPFGPKDGGFAQFALLEVFEPKAGRAALTNEPDLAVPVAVHRRGHSTLTIPKPSLRLETQDEYGGGKDVELLGLPSDNDWVLYGIDCYDKTLMNNPLAFELYRQLGHYSPRTRFVEVYLKQDEGDPGPLSSADYCGLYVLMENLKIAPHRVDLDELQADDLSEPEVSGGYLFAIDDESDLEVANSSLKLVDPDLSILAMPQRAPQLAYLESHLTGFWEVLSRPDWTDPQTGYPAFLDVPAWIDYHLHQVLLFNVDMLRSSAYYCKPRGGKLRPAALWDLDRALGTYVEGDDTRGFNPWRWCTDSGDTGTDPFNAARVFENPWYSRLLRDPNFWQQWIDRYQELRRTVYSSANVTALIDRFAAEVAEATPREYARWTGSGYSDTSPNAGVVSSDGWTYTFPTPGTWEGEVEFLKVWFTNRFLFMDTNFLAPPTLDQPEGALPPGSSLTLYPSDEPGSWVYYTLDGTDPRLPGGEISPRAFASPGPVSLRFPFNVNVCARSWNDSRPTRTGSLHPPLSSPWSGPTKAVYYTALPTLRITEVMYRPGGPEASAGEYLELANVGASTLALAGFRLRGAVEFAFPGTAAIPSLEPGERVLVVKSAAAFAARYPAVASRVAGEYAGQLDDSAGRLILLGPAGETIQDFTYDSRWYPVTDGLGFALVAVDSAAPATAESDPSLWRPSAFDGGSPGGPDPAPVSVSPVWINEILPDPVPPEVEAIELWNPNPIFVDIGSWWLTDDRYTPRKYRIPAGTLLPPFGFAVFYRTNSFGLEGATSADAHSAAAFGLKAEGEEVCLFSGDAQGRLTGYVQGFPYGPTAPGVTVGPCLTSLGATQYVPQSGDTLGATNNGPAVGPLVISELMYCPRALTIGGLQVANTRDSYLELFNVTDWPLALGNAGDAVGSWRLDGGVRYSFPAGTVVPPYGFIVVVGFSPEADPLARAAFLAAYNLPESTPLFGPFEGQLSRTGDRIELVRPSGPGAEANSVSGIPVDWVEYASASPWSPFANGWGASLHRQAPQVFGDDPAQWYTADPSPGGESGWVPVQLSIEVTPPNIVLSWASSSQTWTLEEKNLVAPNADWERCPVDPAIEGDRWRVRVSLAFAESKCFRLRRQ